MTYIKTGLFVWLASLLLGPFSSGQIKAPPFKNTAASITFSVRTDKVQQKVFNVKVAAADYKRRFLAVDDLLNSDQYFDIASFCAIQITEKTPITVTSTTVITSFKILPASAGIRARLAKNKILFDIDKPQDLTVEVNGDIFHSLHLFINYSEKFEPNKDDKNLIYFGPGVHTVKSMIIGDNKTVYIAKGATIKAVVGKEEPFATEPSGLKNYAPTFLLKGNNITFKGQGIIDASACPTHARNMITVNGSNIKIEGITLINSSGWTMPLWECNNVSIKNVKIIGYRANTDGINICNSKNVVVEDCFVRTNDDLIVVKAFENKPTVEHVTVKNCVLWNQLAHALSIGAEVRENINDVTFEDCDIIHDTGREWSLRIFHTDQAKISNIKFENIRIAESNRLISVFLGKLPISYKSDLGVIDGITFSNIRATGKTLGIEVLGGDASHTINNLSFDNIFFNNKKLSSKDMRINEFVRDLKISQ